MLKWKSNDDSTQRQKTCLFAALSLTSQGKEPGSRYFKSGFQNRPGSPLCSILATFWIVYIKPDVCNYAQYTAPKYTLLRYLLRCNSISKDVQLVTGIGALHCSREQYSIHCKCIFAKCKCKCNLQIYSENANPLRSINLCSLKTCYRNSQFVQWSDGIISNIIFILTKAPSWTWI